MTYTQEISKKTILRLKNFIKSDKKLKQYRILCKVDKKEMYQWIL